MKHLHSLGLWPSCHGKQVASPLPSHPERDEIYVTLVSQAGQHASMGSLKVQGSGLLPRVSQLLYRGPFGMDTHFPVFHSVQSISAG